MKRRHFLYGTGAILGSSALAAGSLASSVTPKSSTKSNAYKMFVLNKAKYQAMIGETFLFSSSDGQISAKLANVIEHPSTTSAKVEQYTLLFDTHTQALEEKIYFAKSLSLKETPIFLNSTGEGFAEAAFSHIVS